MRQSLMACLVASSLALPVSARAPQSEPQLVVDMFGRGAYRPGGGKPALRLIRFVEPVLPNGSRVVRAEPVMVEGVIRSDGTIQDARVVSPDVLPDLAQQAMRVVRSWAFRPPLLDDGRVFALATFVVDFASASAVPTEVFDKDEPGIELPRIVQVVLPGYTPDGMRRHISGSVELEAIVLPDGRVGLVRVVKSLDAQYGLDRLALAAARQCAFVPAQLNGRAVAFRTDIRYEFVLK